MEKLSALPIIQPESCHKQKDCWYKHPYQTEENEEVEEVPIEADVFILIKSKC